MNWPIWVPIAASMASSSGSGLAHLAAQEVDHARDLAPQQDGKSEGAAQPRLRRRGRTREAAHPAPRRARRAACRWPRRGPAVRSPAQTRSAGSALPDSSAESPGTCQTSAQRNTLAWRSISQSAPNSPPSVSQTAWMIPGAAAPSDVESASTRVTAYCIACRRSACFRSVMSRPMPTRPRMPPRPSVSGTLVVRIDRRSSVRAGEPLAPC